MLPSFFILRNKGFYLGTNLYKCVESRHRPFIDLCYHPSPLWNSRIQLVFYPYSSTSSSFYSDLLEKSEVVPKFSNGFTFTQNVEGTSTLNSNNSRDVGYLYLENMFNVSPREWIKVFLESEDKPTLLSLLTNFQRYIRNLNCRDLLSVMEKCKRSGIRENNEGIDVQHVILCEILYGFLKKNNRILQIRDICRLCRVLLGIKFNKQSDFFGEVPICSRNFDYSKEVETCDSCKNRYGDLLNLSGSDMETLLSVLMGKSLLLQTKDLRKLHENSVIPYLVLVGNRNLTLCSHLVREISWVYRNQFESTNSLHNISILLHTIKRTRSRCIPLVRRIVSRLIMNGELESLLEKESSLFTKLVSMSQIIQFCINTHYTGSLFTKSIDILLFRILRYSHKLFGDLGKDKISDFPNFVSQLCLLAKASNLERKHLNSMIKSTELSVFLSDLENLKPEFSPNDFKTSNIHVQVDAVLKSFNYETILEHYLPPYVLDILLPSNKTIIEVDGPYHYCTTINERINKILKRKEGIHRYEYTLNSKLKSRLLTKSGFKFVNIPFHQWPQSLNEQIHYISQLKI